MADSLTDDFVEKTHDQVGYCELAGDENGNIRLAARCESSFDNQPILFWQE